MPRPSPFGRRWLALAALLLVAAGAVLIVVCRPSRRAQVPLGDWLRTWVLDPPSGEALPERVVRARGRAPMRLVPAGTFWMGRSVGEEQAEAAARARGEPWHPLTEDLPRHSQTIAHPFYVDETEVTVRQWRSWMLGREPADLGPEGDLPVANVAWEEALRYANWAGGDLPTEIEWEYAARGGASGSTFPWGNEDDPSRRNGGGHADGFQGLAPVGSFPPNGFGLCDMIGNVNEWCRDERRRPYAVSNWPEGVRLQPTGQHLIRGGDWLAEPLYLRTSWRGTLQSGPLEVVGFRVIVRTPGPDAPPPP